jgi:hydroxyacylglutathione hydrolase
VTDVTTIKALGSNFIYLHPYGDGGAFVVDPGDAPVVLQVLKQHGLRLTAILVTHHHWDHVAGAADLHTQTGCEVIGTDRGLIPASDRTVADGAVLPFAEVSVHVIATPGHTRQSVCYYVPARNDDGPGVVYTGDTLFVGGCGRLFECDAATMWQSLQRLAALPNETLVYCGHDYTLENCEFAVTIDPDNRRFHDRLAEVQKTIEYGRLTVPSTMAQEKAANIFLQADQSRVKTALGMTSEPPEEVFAELRRRKDLFG